MASRLLSSLVAGSLILSSSVATAQVLEPAADTTLGSRGESRLGEGGDVDAVTAIIFGLIIFTIAIWVNRDGQEVEPPPTSP